MWTTSSISAGAGRISLFQCLESTDLHYVMENHHFCYRKLFYCSLMLCFLSPDLSKIHLHNGLFLSNCSGHKLKYRELHLNALLLQVWLDTSIGCPDRMWSLHGWRYREHDWIRYLGRVEHWVWTTSGGLFSPQLFCNLVNFPTEKDVCCILAFVLPALFQSPLQQPAKDLTSL